MGIKTNHGFTIIEVMLFLAITGALAVAILVGAGVSIGQQRYRDSANSLKSFIQTQYSETANVINDRDNNWVCNAAGAVSQSTTGGGQPRGTSDCVVLGRFVTVDETGTKLTASNVIGHKHADATPAASDILELQNNYDLTISPVGQDNSEVNWGAQIVKPKKTEPLPVSILIVRSPLSGSILTFTKDGVQADSPNSPIGAIMVTPANMSMARDLCINADAGSFVGKRVEVKINAFAASQGAVEIPPENGSTVCDE